MNFSPAGPTRKRKQDDVHRLPHGIVYFTDPVEQPRPVFPASSFDPHSAPTGYREVGVQNQNAFQHEPPISMPAYYYNPSQSQPQSELPMNAFQFNEAQNTSAFQSNFQPVSSTRMYQPIFPSPVVDHSQHISDRLHRTIPTWSRRKVTPVGLKKELNETVDKTVQESGVNVISRLSTAKLSSGSDGVETVDVQVHRKFLVTANRFYLGSSKYKGVCYNKKKGKWRARISNKGKREFLGDWDTEAKAAMIYDARVKQLYENEVNIKDRLNFPDGLGSAVVETTEESDRPET